MSGRPPRRGSRGNKGRGGRGGPQPGYAPSVASTNAPPTRTTTTAKPAEAPPLSITTASVTSSTSTASVRDITVGLKQMQVGETAKRPSRPGFGRKGRPIRLISNFYGLQIPDKNIYQYDVAITPDGIRPAATNRRIFEQWRALPTHAPGQKDVIRLIAYDGQKNFYCPGRLDLGELGELTWDIALVDEDGGRRTQKFKIKIQETTVVQMARLHEHLAGKLEELPRDTIAVLETLLRQRPTSIFASKSTKAGGSFFQLYNNNAQDLGGGLCVQQGWYQACRTTIRQLLMLNLDVSATSFYKPGPLLDTVCAFFNVRDLRDIRQDFFKRGQSKLEKFLKQVTITIDYRKEGRKKYKIKGISASGADKQHMKIPEEDLTREGSVFYGVDPKKTVTVKDYYFKMFNVQLKYPYFPVVLSGQYKQIHIPMELCFIKENQRYIGKLGEMQLANMIKITATKPQERFKRIEAGRKALHDEAAQQQMLRNWQVKIDARPTEVEGRVLEAPRINQGSGGSGGGRGAGRGRGGRGGGGGAGGNPIQNPNNGVWRLDAFYKPAELKFWAVLVVGKDRYATEDKIYNFTYMLSQQMVNKGMKVENFEPKVVFQNDLTIRQGLIEANKWSRPGGTGGPSPDKRAELIIVVLCENKLYDDVKRVAEVDLGIMTQCCLFKKIERANPAYCSNLSLKINTKLAGVNNILVPDALKDVKQVAPQMNQRVMIFGADVTHPAPGQMRDPNAISIAAMTASIDKDFWEYRAAVRTQKGRQERIADIADMVTELVGHYSAKNQGQLPNRLIFYRDGVSEGQFDEIILNELPEIRKAFASKTKEPPKITFIVMNKRHHARFTPSNPNEGDPKSGNVPAGTVVDKDVVHPYEFDFFLTSQSGLQGTSRPTHYHVLWDENAFSADELQEVTYRLCFLFNRCSRSVSLVPAAYYAHLVAARARCHTGDNDDISEVSGGPGRDYGKTEVLAPVKNRMYFA